MKSFLFLLLSLLMNLSSVAQQGIEVELTKAGYRISEKKKTGSIVAGSSFSVLISPPRGVETTLFALGNDSGSRITLFIYDDANGNLIDTVSSAESGVSCRFIPEGGLYRVKIKVAEAPATLQLVAAQREARQPTSHQEVVASRD